MTDIVSSPPIKGDDEFQWEGGYKIERISGLDYPPSDSDAAGTMTFRIESLEDARREIANSISSHRGSKRFSRSSMSSVGVDGQVPDTAEVGVKTPQASQLLPPVSFGRMDSSVSMEYATPAEEFPPPTTTMQVN